MLADTALDADHAQHALEAFDDISGRQFPVITQAWLNAWEYVTRANAKNRRLTTLNPQGKT